MSRTHHRTAALAATALLLAGCSATAAQRPAGQSPPPAAGATSPAAPAQQPEGPAEPVHIAIPSIGIASALMRLGLNDDGTVEVPPADKGMTAGWYTGASVPGEPGPAVIIGHNDTRFGRAVFHDLGKITKGADISVRNSRGKTAHFTVTGTERVSKKAFPTDRVYGPTDTRALRLITCDGVFDAEGHPVDNLIVWAVRS